MYFNDHTLSGNVGRDAVLRETKTGKVLSFSFAHTSPYTKKTTWYDASVWGKRAESLEPLIKKGVSVVLRGESGPDTFKDTKTGEDRFKMVFRAEDVQLERGKGDSGSVSADDDDVADDVETNEELPF